MGSRTAEPGEGEGAETRSADRAVKTEGQGRFFFYTMKNMKISIPESVSWLAGGLDSPWHCLCSPAGAVLSRTCPRQLPPWPRSPRGAGVRGRTGSHPTEGFPKPVPKPHNVHCSVCDKDTVPWTLTLKCALGNVDSQHTGTSKAAGGWVTKKA